MQCNLFGEVENKLLTKKKAAMIIGVCNATINNWVKTGYLQAHGNGCISQDSVNMFIENISGKEKLNARANKLQKIENNNKLICKNIEQKLNIEIFNDNIWKEYENSLSKSFRNKEGIYYTPEYIITDMFKNIEDINIVDVKSKTFLDPCCGGGNFIIQAIEKGFNEKNIYGYDTDINAVEITKKRIFQRTGIINENIICGDFLELQNKLNLKFDYIFTNPPWGKKIPKEMKNEFSKVYQTGNSIDTSSLFFFACLQLLNKNGKLGFLLPEAFFNISTFEDARKTALRFEIERLVDYGKPFKGLITRAQAIILKNNTNKNSKIKCETKDHCIERSQQSFKKIPKHIFNFWANNETAKAIEHIYSLPHITLMNNARWGLGIVTGNNNKVCKTICEKDFVPIFRGQDITANGLKEPSLFISKDLSNCQQVAPLELYKVKEKLIYRFISNKLIFYCDTKQNYILNSANFLILNETFPVSGQQLSDLFNSDFMNWIFSNIFHTHKILRSDLELLPIHTNYFLENKKFNEEKYIDFLNIGKNKNGTYRIKK